MIDLSHIRFGLRSLVANQRPKHPLKLGGGNQQFYNDTTSLKVSYPWSPEPGTRYHAVCLYMAR